MIPRWLAVVVSRICIAYSDFFQRLANRSDEVTIVSGYLNPFAKGRSEKFLGYIVETCIPSSGRKRVP